MKKLAIIFFISTCAFSNARADYLPAKENLVCVAQDPFSLALIPTSSVPCSLATFGEVSNAGNMLNCMTVKVGSVNFIV